MRTVPFTPLGRQVSVLGFGAASLGSRISVGEARRLLERAWDRGITWYDAAPPYGDGEAESILAPFLKSRRDGLVVASKVGIARPRPASISKRLARWLARGAVYRLPSLRALVSKMRPAQTRVPLKPEAIEASVVSSLRALDIDHLDVLALHEPSPVEASDPGIMGEMRRMVGKGYARLVSVAGSPDACLAALRAEEPPDLLQFPSSLFDLAIERIESALPTGRATGLVTHSAMGAGALQRLATLATVHSRSWTGLAAQWGGDERLAPAEALLRYGLECNSSGPVLASMVTGQHLEDNCRIAKSEPVPGFAAALERFVADATKRE